jgi:hypothetical protein
MNPLRAEDLEVVGFNGTPQVECGRTLPVVRRKSDGMHCVLRVSEDSTPSWHDEDEAAEFVAAGRWTRFREPLSFPRSCLSETDGRIERQPMVVHIAQEVLDAAGRVAWPATFGGETFLWHRLEQHGDTLQAACGSAETVEALLNDWAMALKERFDAMSHQGADKASLKHVADLMLSTAVSRPLRWQAYLRYALSQQPERVRRVFETFTRQEFPDVPWESYLVDINSLGDTLKNVPVCSSAMQADKFS